MTLKIQSCGALWQRNEKESYSEMDGYLILSRLNFFALQMRPLHAAS